MLGRVGIEGELDCFALVVRRGAVEDGDAVVGAVGAVDRGRDLLMQIALGVVVFGEDDDPRVVPRWPLRSSLAGCRQSGAHVVANPVDELEHAGVGQDVASLGDLGHLVEEFLLAGEEVRGGAGDGADGGFAHGCRPRDSSSAWRSSSDRAARSSSLPTESVSRLELNWQEIAGPGRRRRLNGLLPSACCTVLRWTRRVRANASIDESRRCCRPVISRPAAACLRLVSPLRRCSRSLRYWSSRAERRSSGASGGRPSMSICDDFAFGKAAEDFSDIVFEPADHDVVEHLLA